MIRTKLIIKLDFRFLKGQGAAHEFTEDWHYNSNADSSRRDCPDKSVERNDMARLLEDAFQVWADRITS